MKFQTSLSLAIFLLLLTRIFIRSFSTPSNHLLLPFPTNHFPAGVFLNTFFTGISFGILFAYLDHVNQSHFSSVNYALCPDSIASQMLRFSTHRAPPPPNNATLSNSDHPWSITVHITGTPSFKEAERSLTHGKAFARFLLGVCVALKHCAVKI
jgi:hypothetical protein